MCFSIKETVLSMQYSQQRKTKLCTHHWDNENRQGLINMQRSDWHNTNLLIIFVTLKRNQHYLVICTIKYIILDYISRLSNPRSPTKSTLSKQISGRRLCRMSTSSNSYQSLVQCLYSKVLISSSFPKNRSNHECHQCCTKPCSNHCYLLSLYICP